MLDLFLMANVKCNDCGAKTLAPVPVELDSRNTVIAREENAQLPEGWTMVGGFDDDWRYEEDGAACVECSSKRAKAKEEKLAKEAERKAIGKAKRDAKKAAKLAELAKKETQQDA